MRHVFFKLVIVLIALCVRPYAVPASEAPSPYVVKAAKEGMKSFFNADRLDSLHSHGFNSQSDLDKAALAEGFEIFTIPADKLLDESLSQDLDSLITSTNRWMFLVRVQDEAKTLVTVALIDGKWTPVEFGSPEFARVLDSFLRAWPPSSGYKYRYVKLFQAGASFIELYKEDKFVGIVPGPMLLSFKNKEKPKEYDPHKLIGTAGILEALRPPTKNNIDVWKERKGKIND